jgi:hypothetical protein
MRNFIDIISLFEDALRMDDISRMRRAKDQGYTTPAFHGTDASFNEFDMEKGHAHMSGGNAPYFADKRGEAAGYAKENPASNIMEVLLRIRIPLYVQNQFGLAPEQYDKISPDLYKAISGGPLPHESKRELYLTVADAFRHARSHFHDEHGLQDHKATWAGIYARLKKLGYDAIIFPNTRADHGTENYQKIVMLDMSGIRLTTAAFDPTRQDSTDLMA